MRKQIDGRRGAPLLVNFWAVWCKPCVMELPDLGRIAARSVKPRVEVLGVNLDLALEDDSPETRGRIEAVLARAGAGYPNLLYTGTQDALADAFDLPGPLPHSILFAADGRIVRRWLGTLSRDEVEKTLQTLERGSAGK